nr:protein NEDD1 [Aedes albopictus]
MYEILSCAKNTQLHSFPSLDVLGVGTHANDGKDSNESVCQFFPRTKLFLRTNRNWGVELLRIKDINGMPTMAHVQKRTIDNLYCVACPKTAIEEVAVGMTSGSIRLMNLKNTTAGLKRLDTDRLTNGVICMDYSANDDFLAAVYENGTVNLYGTKTNSRVGSMAFDKHTTKVRFHPLKRFLLSVASYKGSVMLYDTQSKKIIFNQTEAHSEPCRDVAMTASNSDLLFTVGYDNLINIYDTRKKQSATKIRSNYPFESLDVSECGGYFAVGNLKGQIYCYDIRSLAEPLKTVKAHDSRVNSIAFVPKTAEKGGHRVSFDPKQVPSTSEITVAANSSSMTAEITRSPALPTKPDRDSFMNDIDAFMQRRESLDVARLSTSSRMSTESRTSLNMAGNNLMGYLDDISDSNLDPDQLEETPAAEESFVNVNRLIKRTAGVKKQTSVDRTQKSAINLNLENIREEPDMDSIRALTEISTDSNVESGPRTGSAGSGTKRSSIRRSVDAEDKENLATAVDARAQPAPALDPTRKNSSSTAVNEEEMSPSVQAAFRDLKLEISTLREEMQEHFFQNQVDRKYTAMATRSQIWMGSFNLWRESQKQLERIDEVTQTGFGMLLTNDEFTQQFVRLQRENEELKRRIAEMEKQGGAKK